MSIHFSLQGRGGTSVKNMYLIEDIICTKYIKNSELHTNNL